MIRPAHIFLGVLLTPDRRTDAVFSSLGVSASQLATAVYIELGRPLPADLSGRDLAYTRQGKLVLERACLYAEHLGWGWLGAVHLLQSLSELHWGTARRLLRSIGASPERLHQVIEAVSRPLAPALSSEPPFVWAVPVEASYGQDSAPPAL